MSYPKIALIGSGQIGGTMALLAAQKKLGAITLIDITEGIPEGKALDLTQSSPIQNLSHSIRGSSDYKELRDADVVIVTAGLPRKPGMSRDDLVEINTKIVRQVGEEIKKRAPKAFVIMVTNPLDAMVWVMQQATGFLPNRVVGMAGILDTARFCSFLAQDIGVATSDVQAMVLGGHGDLMVPLPRLASVGGIPLPTCLEMGLTTEKRIEAIVDRTRNGGGEIVKLFKTGSAFYAPASAAIQMAESYLRDEKKILPCAAYLKGEYGHKDIYAGVPIILGRNGVEKILELPLQKEEQAAFDASIKGVKSLIEAAKPHLSPKP